MWIARKLLSSGRKKCSYYFGPEGVVIIPIYFLILLFVATPLLQIGSTRVLFVATPMNSLQCTLFVATTMNSLQCTLFCVQCVLL